MNEEKKYQVIKRLVESDGNKHRAAVELGCTLRTVNRLIARYKNEGKAAFSHGNKKRKPACALSEETKNEILILYDSKYSGCNIRHFTELLERNEGIKVAENTVRSILLTSEIISPKAHKSTKKELKNRLKEKNSQASETKKTRIFYERITSAYCLQVKQR